MITCLPLLAGQRDDEPDNAHPVDAGVLLLCRSFSFFPPGLPAELLGQEVSLAPDCVGEEVKKQIAALQNGQVLLLENVR